MKRNHGITWQGIELMFGLLAQIILDGGVIKLETGHKFYIANKSKPLNQINGGLRQ